MYCFWFSITFNHYSLDESKIQKESKKVPMVAIAASVAGLFALLVILAIFFIVRKKKGKSTEGMYEPPDRVSDFTQSFSFNFV